MAEICGIANIHPSNKIGGTDSLTLRVAKRSASQQRVGLCVATSIEAKAQDQAQGKAKAKEKRDQLT